MAGEEDPSNMKVLVIDDESDSRVLMAQHLEEFGCRVYTARSGEEGLAMARKLRPNLVTLDLMMPDMTGWEALRRFKEDEALRKIPVVIVSIVASEGRERLLGAVDLLTKPVEREDLLRVVWRNMKRKDGGRVLVVEDDDDTRELLTQYLEGAGLDVVTAEDGAEGLHQVEQTTPDAVLLDLMMPVLDGMSFLDRLRRNPYHNGLPVIVLTAKELTRQEREFLAEKASTVIAKGDEVESRLREALGAILPIDGGDAS